MRKLIAQNSRFLMRSASCLYGMVLVLAAAPSQAALPLSNEPLFLTVAVPPNIVLTLDDSGSMRRAYVPELPASSCPNDPSDCSVLDNRYWKASNKNGLYYNPNVVYPVGKRANGTNLTTSFTSAYKDGFDTALGTVNLSTSYRPYAFFELKPDFGDGAVTEGFMGHFSSDMSCGGSPRRCQTSNGNGGVFRTGTSCSVDSTCRGLQGSGVNPVGTNAYYYAFKPGNAGCSGTTAQKEVDNDCYTIVLVDADSGPGTKDLNGDGQINDADKDERQNFANWFSFARTRNLAVKTATSLAFAGLPPTARVGWQALNTCRGSSSSLVDTDCDGYKNNSSEVRNAIREFTGTHKSNFYNWLYQLPTNSGTPLPDAMERVGEYYRTSGENSPYDNDFTASSSGEYACRRNYHVMFTDGIWTTAVGVGNKDNATTSLPQSVNTVSTYTPASPYKDSTSSTLADVAFKYWIEDARSNTNSPLENNLTPSFKDRTGDAAAQFKNPRNDPAVWQHMVNFTIGLGLTDYLTNAGLTWGGNMYSGSYNNLVSGATTWPAASTALNNPANVADLWHAAINSRGQFFSADDPASLATAFQTSINAIQAGTGSNSALASNTTSLNLSNTVIYQAKFAEDWSGTLLALPVSGAGAVGEAIWDAAKLIPPAASRTIYTRNDSTNMGVLFNSCANLSPTQKAALDTPFGSSIPDNLCSERLKWLRGDSSDEQRNGGSFRNRTNGVMGDILQSNPAYVKNIDYGYSGVPGSVAGQSTYASYVSANAARAPMVYVGSNDGRLYGIDATTGIEKFSYIPGSVYEKLSALTDPSYIHKYYVDGPVTVGDAYLNGAWKTMLLGGLNAGGKSVYALDVTTPDSFGVANIKWEFTDSTMGFSFSQPQIGVLQNGQWVAVFGNGYNSLNDGAHLYIVNLDTGALLKKITVPTPVGMTNGLSTPALYDANNDRLIDTIYAGDLLGNMWKFDVSGALGDWASAFGSNPLFQARYNNTYGSQPITAQPTVVPHPQPGTTLPAAALVVFGTGRYLTAGDLADTTVQTVYGLRDNGQRITTTDRSDLQVQSFDAQGTVAERAVRTVTSNNVDYGVKKGYYLDLVNPTSPTNIGERVTSALLVKRGKIIITSIAPASNPCSPGGTSFLTETSASGGGALGYCAIDINGDLSVSDTDRLGERCSSSVELPVGLSTTALYLTADPSNEDGLDIKLHTGTSGAIVATGQGDEPTPPCPPGSTAPECVCPSGSCGTGPPSVKRRSWIQIR